MEISYPRPLGKARKNLADELWEGKGRHCVVLHHRERIETCTRRLSPEEVLVPPRLHRQERIETARYYTSSRHRM